MSVRDFKENGSDSDSLEYSNDEQSESNPQI